MDQESPKSLISYSGSGSRAGIITPLFLIFSHLSVCYAARRVRGQEPDEVAGGAAHAHDRPGVVGRHVEGQHSVPGIFRGVEPRRQTQRHDCLHGEFDLCMVRQ